MMQILSQFILGMLRNTFNLQRLKLYLQNSYGFCFKRETKPVMKRAIFLRYRIMFDNCWFLIGPNSNHKPFTIISQVSCTLRNNTEIEQTKIIVSQDK